MKYLCRFIVSVFIMLAAMSATACSRHVLSSSALKRHAEDCYGSAELVSQRQQDQSRILYLKDSEYKFEYWVRGSFKDFHMDGSDLFHYINYESDFEYQYYNHICDLISPDLKQLEISSQTDIQLIEKAASAHATSDCILAKLYLTDTADPLIPARTIAGLFRQFDTRNYWQQQKIELYRSDGTYTGFYDSAADSVISAREQDLHRFELMAREYDPASRYLKSELVTKEEFSGMAELPDNFVSYSHDDVTLYYFQTEAGATFYIADVKVHGKCYSNYSDAADGR